MWPFVILYSLLQPARPAPVAADRECTAAGNWWGQNCSKPGRNIARPSGRSIRDNLRDYPKTHHAICVLATMTGPRNDSSSRSLPRTSLRKDFNHEKHRSLPSTLRIDAQQRPVRSGPVRPGAEALLRPGVVRDQSRPEKVALDVVHLPPTCGAGSQFHLAGALDHDPRGSRSVPGAPGAGAEAGGVRRGGARRRGALGARDLRPPGRPEAEIVRHPVRNRFASGFGVP